jgi:hypothetical protein
MAYSNPQHNMNHGLLRPIVSSQRGSHWKGCDTSHKLTVIWKPFDADALRTAIKSMAGDLNFTRFEPGREPRPSDNQGPWRCSHWAGGARHRQRMHAEGRLHDMLPEFVSKRGTIATLPRCRSTFPDRK